MSDEQVDPSGTTDQFRAFVQSAETAPPARFRTPIVLGGLALVVVVAVVVALLMVG
jgi:hypothetical protein